MDVVLTGYSKTQGVELEEDVEEREDKEGSSNIEQKEESGIRRRRAKEMTGGGESGRGGRGER